MYRFSKSRSIFFHTLKLFRKKRKKLPDSVRAEIHTALTSFQNHLVQKDVEEAHNLAKKCELLSKLHMKKTAFDHFFEVIFAIFFALIIATVIRQMWFEFYQIPTGSMRPTLVENDRLLVSKTQFGINVPLMLKHFYFNPDEVKRNGIFIFTGEDMDIPENKTRYFYLFPGYKQYVKRVLGKPGDLLYFYGGQLYGIDKEGNDISAELQPKELKSINHVPFMSLEGKVKFPRLSDSKIVSPVLIYQMNQPVAKLYVTAMQQIKNDILYTTNKANPPVKHYADLWGMKNYAMAQILHEDGKYILELLHNPNLENAQLLPGHFGKLIPTLATSKSYIGLNERSLKKIFDNLTTTRFVVKNGFLRHFSQNSPPIQEGIKNHYPKLSGIPNGTYEFIHGQLYQIFWQGIARRVSSNHPLAQYSPDKTALLFNLGNNFDVRFLPESMYAVHPYRYAFFKDHAFYLMGREIFSHDDPLLVQYINRELEREKNSHGSYIPFIDHGPPLTKDGEIDKALIQQAGLRIPEGHYLGLGDNYAVSFDSRGFGFIPQNNVKGVPEIIFWPPGSRLGPLLQPFYPIFTASRILIWAIAACVLIIWGVISRKRNHLPTHIPQ